MRHTLVSLALIALLAFVAGCDQSQSPAEGSSPSEAPTGDATAAERPSEPTTGPVTLVPATLDACEPGAVVVVHWDMRETHPDITDVEIWTGAVGNQTLFAAGGYTGEASTVQPWAHPGTIFSVRNKADGEEVASAVVGGPDCNW